MNIVDAFECEIQMLGVNEDSSFAVGGAAELMVGVVK
jgi:hypothetical protein